MEVSWTFLMIFGWAYVGFFAALYDWYKTFGEWSYKTAFLGAMAGPFMLLSLIGKLPLPLPSSVSSKGKAK